MFLVGELVVGLLQAWIAILACGTYALQAARAQGGIAVSCTFGNDSSALDAQLEVAETTGY